MSNIMITGGTGTLGKAIIRKLLSTPKLHGYNKIIVYSRDEMKQDEMYKEFKPLDKDNRVRYFIGDIRDKQRLSLALRGVTHIIHAAALKIVPALEYNPMEAVKTNILGTQNLLECIVERNLPTNMIAVSTDKAVRPINLYGSTKLTMEKLVLAANNVSGPTNNINFGVVRYGNVSCSRGSVIPVFQNQIKQGHSVTITHKDMTRFWITTEQAADYVLATLWVLPKTSKRLFTPVMKSYKVTNLAKALGAKEIKYVGIRPGEKLHEEIMTAQEKQEQNTLLPLSSDKAKKMSVKELKKALKEIGALQ